MGYERADTRCRAPRSTAVDQRRIGGECPRCILVLYLSRRTEAELFVTLLKKMMRYRAKPVHLVLDSLPAHKTSLVKAYVASTNGRLTLHFLPGYAPELNPDELVWSHVKRTGVARTPLRKGDKLTDKIEAQLGCYQKNATARPLIFQGATCRLYYRLLSNSPFIATVFGRTTKTVH